MKAAITFLFVSRWGRRRHCSLRLLQHLSRIPSNSLFNLSYVLRLLLKLVVFENSGLPVPILFHQSRDLYGCSYSAGAYFIV